uniref:NADP-dependent oxidoreductase domain-containing protein n=1 Tax=Romanomermis culicivorax TaxID=13658 RepID=A0A915IAE4_ROMCU
MITNQSCLTLNSGYQIPQIGLGTWQCKSNEVEKVIETAIQVGYRHLDCAPIYGNEAQIGSTLNKIFESETVVREELFITSKIWSTFHSFKNATICLEKILKDLQLECLDLCLIHWPMGYQEGGESFPKDEYGKPAYSDVDYLETWRALENASKLGKVKSIGLSNFNESQIGRILENCTIQPANLQIECHPYMDQSHLIDYCKSQGIVVTSYGPLSSPANMFRQSSDPSLFDEPVLRSLAQKHSKTIPQIVLKWHIQRGVCAIPKSTKREHLIENLNIWDFELSNEDMALINGINKSWRIVTLDRDRDHVFYPFK